MPVIVVLVRLEVVEALFEVDDEDEVEVVVSVEPDEVNLSRREVTV